MLTKSQKQDQITWIKEKLDQNKLIVFVTYRGLNIADNFTLRKQFKSEGLGFKAVKSSLLKLALKDFEIELDESIASLPLAIAFGQDEVMPAKLVAKFITKLDNQDTLKIVGGISEKKWLDGAAVQKLAALPSRNELYAKLVGVIKNPAYRLVNALRYPSHALTLVLKQKT